MAIKNVDFCLSILHFKINHKCFCSMKNERYKFYKTNIRKVFVFFIEIFVTVEAIIEHILNF